MLEILGKSYYIDVDKVISQCRPVYYPPRQVEKVESEESTDTPEIPQGGLELNVFKFEIFKACLDRVLNEYNDEEKDDIPVFQEKGTTLSFRLAFNTLLKNQILIEEEND